MTNHVRSYGNYINGQWTEPESGRYAPSTNPANTADVVGQLALSGEGDVDRAVQAAQAASKAWRKLGGPARGEYLYKAAAILERRLDEVARTMTLEMGKTLPEAKGETARGIAILKYYAGEGMRKIGDLIPSTDSEALMFTTRVPLGVVGVISPWNFPVAIPVWKIAPALVYGNTVVWKPALETGITAALIMECFAEAGLPNGVLNMLLGSGSVVGNAIVHHQGVHGVTFTGSNAVGKQVGAACLARGAKYQLEMGGKNPIIIAADADLDLAVEATISGGIRSTGQKCTATSRVIIEKPVYEAFRSKLLERIRQLKIGDGLRADTWLGPCANEHQLNTVLGYIEKGKAEGAELIYGGYRPQDEELKSGYFIVPAVFDKVNSRMTIAQEEIFGPVLALIEAADLEEAIRLANDVEYGLSASIYTRNIGNFLRFVDEVDAGLIRINAETAGVELQAPFGGMKQSSSHSREQGRAAIEFFTSIKTVFVKA